MKKIISALLAFSLLFALSGCKKEQSAEDASLKSVTEKGKLVIGLDDTFAPMGFRDEGGELCGFDIDLAKEVCQRLGVEPVFQPIDWDAKELELKSGTIDCIWNGLSITPGRKESMSLSSPYLNNRIIVMSLGASLEDKSQLEGKNIGIQAASAALDALMADDIYSKVKDNVTEYPTYDEVIMDMQAGRLDCMIIDEVYGSYKNQALGEIFSTAGFDFGDDLYAVGFRKEDIALTDGVSAALAALIKDGTASRISQTWFGRDIVVK